MTSSRYTVVQPYLSVVVTTRNDDHGGNPLGRTQAFINGLIGQCRRHQLHAELIIVEWNPPPDRPPLVEVLDWPDDQGFCKVRIIEVPPEIHQRLRHWQAMPLYQMIGKNVGIRRAHGEFVLATNIDILFSDELMHFIAERRLEPGKMYRVNRWDVMADVPVNAPVEEQLAYCQSHLIRLNAREGTFRLDLDGSRVVELNDIVRPDGPVRLGANWFAREISGEEPFRWVDNDAEIIIGAGLDQNTLALDVEPGPGVNMSPFTLELQDAAGQRLAEVQVKRRTVITFTLPPFDAENLRVRLHTRDGGRRIGTDLRTLNFRLFRCALEGAADSGPAQTKEIVSAHVRRTQALTSRVGRGIKLAREIWRGNPNVQIRLPMSRERLARLQLRQDANSVSFSARALQSRGELREDVLPEGMRAIFGPGWYAVEYFAGETFRWIQESADIVWLAPMNAPTAFLLDVEPGPACGFKACEVTIRDQWGAVLSTHQVKGRSTIRIPISQPNGPLVTTFEIKGAGAAESAPGDPRILALRIFGGRWDGSFDEPDGPQMSGEVLPAGPGVWYANGWKHSSHRPEGNGIDATPGAELVVRAPETGEYTLAMEISPIQDGSNGSELVIMDAAGRELFRGPVEQPQFVRVGGTFQGGHYYAFRLCGPPDASDQAWLGVSAIWWEGMGGNPSRDRVRIPLQRASSDQAVWLHTNACGDFTLMARENWADLRAYPELDLFSMNIDSIFCWTAHHGGAREQILEDPMRIYHIEHGSGSGWTPEGERKLFERIAAKGLPWVDYHEVVEWARIMNRFDAPMIFNREDWGFAKDELKETVPQPGAPIG